MISPDEIALRVKAAHRRALDNRQMFMQRSSSIQALFRDVRLYGRDAARDFVETHIGQIVQEAVDAAECRAGFLEMWLHGFGKAAMEGMADALREMTGLDVELAANVVKLRWGDDAKDQA